MALITVEPIMFLFVLTYGSQMFLTQDLVFKMLCSSEINDEEICANPTYNENDTIADELVQIDSQVVILWMYWTVTYTFMSIIIGQIFGYYMDRYSKKIIMIIPQIGQVLMSLGYILICIFNAPLLTIYILPFVGGLTGGFVVIKAAAMSYIAQISKSNEETTSKISIMEGCFYVGGSVALIGIKLLIEYVTDRYDILFLILMSVNILSIIYTAFVLKDCSVITNDNNCTTNKRYNCIENSYNQQQMNENPGVYTIQLKDTISPNASQINIEEGNELCKRDQKLNKRSEIIESSNSNICLNIIDSIKTTLRKRENGERAIIIACTVGDILSLILFTVELDLSYIYFKDKVLWSFPDFLQYYGIKTCADGISLLLILPLLRTYLFSDSSLGILGSISRFVFFIYIGLVASSAGVYWAIVINFFGNYTLVVSRAIVSQMVLDSEQGRVFTILSSWEQISCVAASLSFDNLYSYLLKQEMPEVTMFISAAIGVIAILVYGWIYFAISRRQKAEFLTTKL